MKRITEYDNITTVSESDVLPIVDVSDTEQASTGSTRKGTIETIADYLKARVETLTNKTLTTPKINEDVTVMATSTEINKLDGLSGGVVGTTDTQTLTNKTLSTGSVIDTNVTVTEVLKKVYPIGCIYTSTVSTNPNTLFGFGTWSAFGAGKVMVGLDSTDADFDTAEETGGAKTHTLTTAQTPEHNHSIAAYTNSAAGANSMVMRGNIGTGAAGNLTTGNTGSGSAHNNLQPYIVTYFWKRTA